ncbi:hypothetical protein C0991_000556 [Blastosporella zonata]|nr:hypothetical protein C0991_000556 [Blastosporella zonata]
MHNRQDHILDDDEAIPNTTVTDTSDKRFGEDTVILQCSSRTSRPTDKANPDRTTQTQQAVQESRQAEECLKASQVKRGNDNIATETANAQPQVDVNSTMPDLTQIADADDLDNLLAAVAKIDEGPLHPDTSDEPRTWREAHNSADAKQWEAATKRNFSR